MLNPYRKYAKKLGAVILTLGIALGSTACSSSDFEALEKAEVKTEAVSTGISAVDLQIENDMVTTGLTAEQLKIVNYMKAVAYKGEYSFDKSKNQAISQSWVNLGGIGFDFTYYKDQDKQFVRYPVLKKYIDLSQLTSQGGQSFNLSPETHKALGEVWNKLYTKDTVKQIEKTFVTTTEGDVKATRYDVSASGEAVKAAILESQKLIMADAAVKAKLASAKNEAQASGESIQITGLPEDVVLKNFQMSAYVDADGYLIKETIIMGLVLPEGKNNSYWKGTDFSMTTTYSKLGQTLKLDIPQVTKADMMTEEEMQRNMPAAFSDLVK